MPILLLQHHDVETPGRLGDSLRNLGHRLEVRRPDRDGLDALPTDMRSFDGLIVMGGPQNADAHGLSESPWLQGECDLIATAHEAELPVIGVCLGAQLIAHALGGKVEAMKSPEVGFAPVGITTAGQVDAMLAGIAWESPQFQAHGRQITELPGGATLLASSDACANQAFKVGLRTYGFQYHFECDQAMIEAFRAHCSNLFDRAGVTRDGLAELVERDYEMFARSADRLCDMITLLAFPFVSRRSA